MSDLSISLEQCLHRNVVDEARKCIKDIKNKDLSACGSVVMLKEYAPLAVLSNFLCSG